MGTGEEAASLAAHDSEVSISELCRKHKQDLDNLTLVNQPFKTLKFFTLGVLQYAGILVLTIEGPHEKHVEEIVKYFDYGLWWVILGVASSIGLGSGLHTFVLYLGPHIGFFTIKAVQCGRVDLKSAVYDTIQLKRGPSWLEKDCSEFGPPVFTSQVPLSSILPMVQIEAILWGIGTSLGELPPYFISRAARLSGGRSEAMEELDASSRETDGLISTYLNRIKRWFLSHAQHLNFLTILLLASIPNPLFDLAGIMCGQFGVPFWEFFFATLVGKAIIKTHIQTIFIIAVCNNQLLDWIENELLWILSFVPGFSSILPGLVAKLNAVKSKYLKAPSQVAANAKAKKWDFSVSSIWNTIVWLMIMNFSIKIMTSTAQRYLKKQQDEELAAMTDKVSASACSN
ncbi:vacuole membrane protein KMS1-like isoform X2 [Cucurbita pepo subsp. pepo]|uniref:vacuole membrane protein KMS1-like isoform X2 n=1 Tax=Cucurbita pepo subsp. pepo TaxID=3664 RepID=UPI000C9D7621|nr:vacuole membrane protein KMS1-like isoform X2 [Cucurbita pepo subsp. pepo]